MTRSENFFNLQTIISTLAEVTMISIGILSGCYATSAKK